MTSPLRNLLDRVEQGEGADYDLTQLSDADLEAAIREADEQFGYREQYGIKASGLVGRMVALDAEATRRSWHDGERPKEEAEPALLRAKIAQEERT